MSAAQGELDVVAYQRRGILRTEFSTYNVSHVRCLEESLPQSTVGKSMLRFLENAAGLTRSKAYGLIGKMEDWIERIPIQRPIVFSDLVQRDALLLIVLDLDDELTWSEYAVLKNELVNSMPSLEYRRNIHYALLEFLSRVPAHALGMIVMYDGGVFLGVATPIVVVNPLCPVDPFHAD